MSHNVYYGKYHRNSIFIPVQISVSKKCVIRPLGTPYEPRLTADSGVFFRAENDANSASFCASKPLLSRAVSVAFCRLFSCAVSRVEYTEIARQNVHEPTHFGARPTRVSVRKIVLEPALERVFLTPFSMSNSMPLDTYFGIQICVFLG